MKEIWDLAISPGMLPLTILLVFVMVYWLLSVVGAVDGDSFDLDGGDASGGDGGHHHPVLDWLHGALRIINAKDVPLMLVLSLIIILLWGGAMLGNTWFSSSAVGGWAGTLIVVGALVVSVVLTRLVLIPFKPLFRLMSEEAEKIAPVPGRTGIVRTAFVTESEGQVEVDSRGAPLLLNARIAHGADKISRGTEVLIVSQDPDNGLCMVRPLNETTSH